MLNCRLPLNVQAKKGLGLRIGGLTSVGLEHTLPLELCTSAARNNIKVADSENAADTASVVMR